MERHVGNGEEPEIIVAATVCSKYRSSLSQLCMEPTPSEYVVKHLPKICLRYS